MIELALLLRQMALLYAAVVSLVSLEVNVAQSTGSSSLSSFHDRAVSNFCKLDSSVCNLRIGLSSW